MGRQSVRLQMTSQNRQVPQDQGPQAPPAEAMELRQGRSRKNMSSEPLLLMACRYSREAADTEWPQPSAFRSPTEQSLATPQTGQTWSRLYRVGATHYHRADNDYGQFTIANSVRPALSLWLRSEDKHTMKLPGLTGDLRYREPRQPSGTYSISSDSFIYALYYPHVAQIFWRACLSTLCKVKTAAMTKGTCCFHYVACTFSPHPGMVWFKPCWCSGVSSVTLSFPNDDLLVHRGHTFPSAQALP